MNITSIDQINPNGSYTYQDYLTWDFPQRMELYRGKPFELSPAPNRRHQDISTELFGNLYNHLRDGPYKVYAAPFDVRLPITNKKGQPDTVVQPDLSVVCDESKLDKQGCNGAPDLVVEILSPGNPSREMREKFDLYEEAGVQEYWLVQPEGEMVNVYILNEEGKFIGLRPLDGIGQLTSTIFPDLTIDLSKVFAQ
jgi:Uma2 family endonuclease